MVGVGVGGEQAAVDEGLQLGEHLGGQLVAANAPAGGAALLVDGDEPEELSDHLLALSASSPYWGGEDIDTMAPDPKTRLSHVRAAVLEVHGGNLVATEH